MNFATKEKRKLNLAAHEKENLKIILCKWTQPKFYLSDFQRYQELSSYPDCLNLATQKEEKKKTANSATKKDWKFKWFGHRYWSVWVKVFPAQQTEIQRLKKVSAWQTSQILYNSR